MRKSDLEFADHLMHNTHFTMAFPKSQWYDPQRKNVTAI